MASSKEKITEKKQLNEGLFTKIMSNILRGRIRRVSAAVSDVPRIKKAAEEADKAIKELDKQIKKSNKVWKSGTKGLKL
jgi:hypothetical protein